jgi:hypothetical protein
MDVPRKPISKLLTQGATKEKTPIAHCRYEGKGGSRGEGGKRTKAMAKSAVQTGTHPKSGS